MTLQATASTTTAITIFILCLHLHILNRFFKSCFVVVVVVVVCFLSLLESSV